MGRTRFVSDVSERAMLIFRRRALLVAAVAGVLVIVASVSVAAGRVGSSVLASGVCDPSQESSAGAAPLSTQPSASHAKSSARTEGGQPNTFNGGTTAPGPGLDPVSAADRALQGLGDPSVASVRVVGKLSDFAPPSLDIRMQAGQPDDLRTQWLGDLLDGAVADLMRTDQSTTSDVIFGGDLLFPQPDGSVQTVGLGHGAVAGGQVFDSPSDAAITTHVCTVASSYGLSVGSLRVLHPLDSAIEVSLVVPDSAEPTWTISQLIDELEGSPTRIEGIYVQLDSPDGQKLLAVSDAYRMASGGLWFAPGQDVRFGANHEDAAPLEPTS